MESVSQLLLNFLVNACWQVGLLAVVATLSARMLRGASARSRHQLWVAVLVVSFGLPVLTGASLSGGVIFSRQAQRQATQEVNLESLPLTQANLAYAPTSISPSLKETWPSLVINQHTAAGLAAIYLLFLCYRSGNLLMAWRRTRIIGKDVHPIERSERVQTIIDECQKALGVTGFRVMCSASITVPMTMGSLNPLVIVPERLLAEADADVLTAAIGHELVHVLRRDYIFNLIYELIYLPLSFHPAAALVRRRINQTRELGCDELVAEKLLDAKVYARSLVHLAGLAGAAIPLRQPTTSISVGIADADILEERVMTMLKRSKTNVGRKSWLLAAACLCFAVPCMAAAPFALRININPRGSAATSEEVAVTPLMTSVTPHADAEQVKQEAKQNEERPRSEVREATPKSQTEMEARRREEQQLRDAALTTQQEPAQEAREKREKEEQMLKKLRVMEEMRAREEFESQNPEIAAKRRVEREVKAKARAELAKQANITMQQAIQIATNQYPGTVMESRLLREWDQACYFIGILSENGEESNFTGVMVSAIDGKVLKAFKEER